MTVILMSLRDSLNIGKNPIKRRKALRLGIPLIVGAIGVSPVAAEPIDGKGNDVCPCFFDINEAELQEDGTIEVSGPCEVETPPEEVSVQVKVRGKRGARAIGSETFICDAETDSFSVAAIVRGTNRFEKDTEVNIHAKVHINSENDPAITGRWTWTGDLS